MPNEEKTNCLYRTVKEASDSQTSEELSAEKRLSFPLNKNSPQNGSLSAFKLLCIQHASVETLKVTEVCVQEENQSKIDFCKDEFIKLQKNTSPKDMLSQPYPSVLADNTVFVHFRNFDEVTPQQQELLEKKSKTTFKSTRQLSSILTQYQMTVNMMGLSGAHFTLSSSQKLSTESFRDVVPLHFELGSEGTDTFHHIGFGVGKSRANFFHFYFEEDFPAVDILLDFGNACVFPIAITYSDFNLGFTNLPTGGSEHKWAFDLNGNEFGIYTMQKEFTGEAYMTFDSVNNPMLARFGLKQQRVSLEANTPTKKNKILVFCPAFADPFEDFHVTLIASLKGKDSSSIAAWENFHEHNKFNFPPLVPVEPAPQRPEGAPTPIPTTDRPTDRPTHDDDEDSSESSSDDSSKDRPMRPMRPPQRPEPISIKRRSINPLWIVLPIVAVLIVVGVIVTIICCKRRQSKKEAEAFPEEIENPSERNEFNQNSDQDMGEVHIKTSEEPQHLMIQSKAKKGSKKGDLSEKNLSIPHPDGDRVIVPDENEQKEYYRFD